MSLLFLTKYVFFSKGYWIVVNGFVCLRLNFCYFSKCVTFRLCVDCGGSITIEHLKSLFIKPWGQDQFKPENAEVEDMTMTCKF